jgi:Tol biopolymer transport system component/tRNA A-37 threonylcarbamoyl transferase component Bud32
MGEVYRATDTKLGRDVAIKVLPNEVGQDPERLARFRREAHLLATLNHPHVAAIYGLEETAAAPFLVLELVGGEDLGERLKRGPLPVDEALDTARQIAEALEEAHDHGIVHRDLKPANVKITPDGNVKVLDFGLAKAWAGEGDEGSLSDLSRSPTLAHSGTQAGVILGTAAYMSPEQARGKKVDKRADVWALGVVLYEMLVGTPLFAGETVTDVIAAVVTREPDWTTLPEGTPGRVLRLLERCLRKDRRRRLPDAGAARLELSEVLEGGADLPAEGTRREPGRGRTVAWALGLAAALVAGLTLGVLLERPSLDEGVLAFEVDPPEGTSFYLHPERPGAVRVSPDGRMLAFTAEREGQYRLYVRPLSTTVARALPGTEGAQYPFWSPDSRSLGFFSGGKLRKIRVGGGGGPPVALCDATEVKGASWGSEGVIVFAPSFNTPIYRVPEGGGEATPVTELDAERKDDSHRHPRFLPDGRHFLYLARVSGGNRASAVVVASIDGGEEKVLLRSPAAAEYASGHLLFLRELTLMAQPFDPDRLELTGEAFPVAEGVHVPAAGTAIGVFSASQTGVLAYESGGAVAGLHLVWRDREGDEIGVLGDEARYWDVRVSPGADLALVLIADAAGGNSDAWIYEIARNLRTRLTFTEADEWMAAWSPDGTSVFFGSSRGSAYDLYRKTVAGADPEELLYETDRPKIPTSVSPDGRLLLFSEQDAETSWDLWVLPLDHDEARPYPLLQGPFDEVAGMFSPDGRWVAYRSNESGRNEIYIVPFPGPGRKWQVSTEGGLWAEWRADGKEIFYQTTGGDVAALTVEARGEGLAFGAPRRLFPLEAQETDFHFSPTPDGQRFLTIEAVAGQTEQPITVVVNWTALRRE